MSTWTWPAWREDASGVQWLLFGLGGVVWDEGLGEDTSELQVVLSALCAPTPRAGAEVPEDARRTDVLILCSLAPHGASGLRRLAESLVRTADYQDARCCSDCGSWVGHPGTWCPGCACLWSERMGSARSSGEVGAACLLRRFGVPDGTDGVPNGTQTDGDEAE